MSERCCRIGSHTKGPPPLILNGVQDGEEAEHIEQEHHIPVVREGETRFEAMFRFMRERPEAHDCAMCNLLALPWTLDVPPDDDEETVLD